MGADSTALTDNPTDPADRGVMEAYTADQLLVRIVQNCARSAGKARVGVRPRWSVVGDLTGLGSTYAWQLCRHAGVDPDEQVVRRR